MSKVDTDKNRIDELLSRRLENVFPSKEEAMKRFQEGKPLRVYWGIDATGTEIHMGHTIPLLFLKQLIGLGHKPILLIGDFTTRIGDPTNKEVARKALSEEEIKNNMKSYLEQVYKILPRGSFSVDYNSRWLDKLNFGDLLGLASKVTVQQMLQRDMFQERIKKQKPIYLHEFLYPLAQGYDSVAMKVDGELGGNDQTFNMLVGRDLEKEILGKDKLVFATRLLVDAASGKKMSKSEGGFIALNDAPKDIFEKVQNTIPDEIIRTVFELCTEIDLDKIDWNKNPIELKEDLAFELVRMYHGEKEADKAKNEWREKDKQKFIFPITTSTIVGIIVGGSQSSAKALISQGAVEVDGTTIKDWNEERKPGEVIRVGKHRPVEITN